MPFPLLALAVPALIGLVGGVAARYIEGRVTGQPATPGQLLRSGLVGLLLGGIGGNVVTMARLVTAPVARATVVVVGAVRADETARTTRDFVETGRLPFVGQRPTPAPPTPAPPAPPTPASRPTPPSLFDSPLDRLAGQPAREEVPPLLRPTSSFLEGLDQERRPAPAPTRGLLGALRDPGP